MKRWLILATLFAAACGFLSSRSQSRFYSLERIAPSAAVRPLSGAPVGIESLELPPGFDRRDILVRKPDLELEVRRTEQWSASLEPMVLHTLAVDLASRLPDGMMILPGQTKPAVLRGLDVAIEALEAGPDAIVTLDARVALRGVAWHEHIAVPIESLGSAQIAAGYSRALAELADRIAAKL